MVGTGDFSAFQQLFNSEEAGKQPKKQEVGGLPPRGQQNLI